MNARESVAFAELVTGEGHLDCGLHHEFLMYCMNEQNSCMGTNPSKILFTAKYSIRCLQITTSAERF